MKNKIILTFAIISSLLLCGAAVNSKVDAGPDIINLDLNNTVNFRGVVDSVSVTKAILELSELDTLRGSKDYPLYLVLDTPGGSIEDGNDFIQFAKTIKNLHTVSIFAASMGSAIVEALPGDRFITQNGTLMFHRARGGFRGQFNDGEVEQQLAFWKSVVTSMEQENANRMGISLEDYKQKVVNEWWIYGKDAVNQNAADKVVSLKCSKELIEAEEVVPVQLFVFSVDAIYSKCPLLRNALEIIGE